MPPVVVQPVKSARQQKLFLEFPRELYYGDPHWVPPLRHVERQLVGYAPHPFIVHAACQTFLAWRSGQVVGRIAAIVNHAHNQLHRDNIGFFGFFEAKDDPQAAAALLMAARKWLAGHGLHMVRGPVSPSFNYQMGCLVEGFSTPPGFLLPYNPPYYGRLLEACGLRKSQDLYSFVGHTNMVANLDEKIVRVAEEAVRRFDVRFRPMRTNSDLRTYLRIHNQANQGHWGFVPLSDAEIEQAASGLSWLVESRFTALAEVDGKAIGAMLGLLDFGPRIRQSDGKLFPLGLPRLMFGRRRIKRLRIVSALVLPEYQLWGVGIALIHRLRPELLAWGIGEVECSWVAESNPLSKGTLERFGTQRDKTYRIFDG
jgi:GNAT superfamily N-acetyltransferase